MDDDTWVEEAVAQAGPCPSCGARSARPIAYGMPMPGEVERLGDRVEFAGCCLPPDPAAYRCGACGCAWGHYLQD